MGTRYRLLRLVAASGACVGTALALAVCGGVTTTGAPSDASADQTTSLDASPDQDASSVGCGDSCDAGMDVQGDVSSGCPTTPPEQGTACPVGRACEYGSSWWFECNFVTLCLGTGPQGQGQWRVEYDGGQCPWLDSGGPCPATWEEASSADAMPSTCPFVTCVYPEGFCGCGIGCGGGGGLPRPLDVSGTFTCSPSTPSCPEPRPLSGTPCDGGEGCNYGFACGCGQMQECVDGLWQASRAAPCP